MDSCAQVVAPKLCTAGQARVHVHVHERVVALARGAGLEMGVCMIRCVPSFPEFDHKTRAPAL